MYCATTAGVSPDARLGERARDLVTLHQQGLRIQPSFVILADAFDKIIEDNRLTYKFGYLLNLAAADNPGSLLNAYTGVRKALQEATLPQGFENELKELHFALTANTDGRLRIITSLSTPSDPEGTQTILQPITGLDELLAGVREAWALAYHPSQIKWRMQRKFPNPQVALIVQRIEEPSSCCHAYSCMPQDHLKTYLQTYYGQLDLYDKITKDYYALDKEMLDIVLSEIRPQPEILEFDEKGLSPVAFEKTEHDRIIEKEIHELGRLAKKAERLIKEPVKVYFHSVGDDHRVLWVNRLGFSIILKEDAPKAPEPVAHVPEAAPAVQVVEIPAPTAPVIEPVVAPAVPPMPVLEPVAAQPPTRTTSPVLLEAAYHLAKRVIERAYQSAFGTPQAGIGALAVMLNQSKVFDRTLDAAALDALARALRGEHTLSDAEQSRAEAELAFLISKA